MSSFDMHAITLDQATDAHREAVQAIVKAHSQAWWHHFADLWIVQGHDPTYWRDLIQPTLMNSTARLLVFTLPSVSGRGWAGASISMNVSKWLFDTYSGRPELALPAPEDDIPF
jgi:hypothetical protein